MYIAVFIRARHCTLKQMWRWRWR